MLKEKVKKGAALIVVVVIITVLAAISVYSRIKNGTDMIVAVHIKGEINNPGYYELEYGSRLKDAIEKAGGETKEADLNKVNLALRLRDGEELIIPKKGAAEDKVNINTADSYELYTLDGVGSNLAESIVSYREKNGKFKTIEDIKKVPELNSSVYEKIKNYIAV